MFKRLWNWMKSVSAKVWTWIKETNWGYVIDSGEFRYFFPLGVFFLLAGVYWRNPFMWLPLLIWGLIIYRNYGK